MVPLYKPYMPDLPLLNEILHSGKLSYGSYSKQFEESLQSYFDTPFVMAVSSFNLAVSVVLTCFDIKAGDEAVASPMACLASTQPYASAGLKIVWADIDPETGTLCPDAVKKKITGKTKIVVHNHFCGYPGYADEINRIGSEYGLFVIDDGIECFGSIYKGKKIGNCGTDATIFSFGPVRIPNTIDGGAIIFKNKADFEKGLLIRDCGIERSRFRDETGEIDPACDITLNGYSATMNDVNGYIGYEQMKAADRLIEKQRVNAARWNEALYKTPYSPMKTPNGEPNYWVYGIKAPDKKAAIDKFRKAGYYASGVHINNNIYSVFNDKRPLAGVDEFYKRFIALPCGWWAEVPESI